jgi:hypothetical protein
MRAPASTPRLTKLPRASSGTWQPDLPFVPKQEVDMYDLCKQRISECDLRPRSTPDPVSNGNDDQVWTLRHRTRSFRDLRSRRYAAMSGEPRLERRRRCGRTCVPTAPHADVLSCEDFPIPAKLRAPRLVILSSLRNMTLDSPPTRQRRSPHGLTPSFLLKRLVPPSDKRAQSRHVPGVVRKNQRTRFLLYVSGSVRRCGRPQSMRRPPHG